ncbi:hypothetical protein H072_1947 [Dactylellina haptotyla CBS 200.50]|uniref:Prenyltransferase alpha-alpha toroid domain-containing protein n=1 Tax=Dactylellina haptotyla (strain CBS 200.50) TaxID=1284197 RepID=S8BX49_DACHA|nr:hypothetical protein H072_1947 [Dactylellina haptotyla CBS 200.50]
MADINPSSTTLTSSEPPPPKPRATFEKQRNIKYWLRCLRTLLPTEYTSNDLNRTSLAFFCVNGLHVIGELGNLTKPEEREEWISWLYSCQIPSGAGFRGGPATDLSDKRSPDNEMWDPPTLPGTFFCIITLLSLGDDLARINREATLEWVASLQRSDGSFAEMRTGAEELEKDHTLTRDPRFIYLAAAIRWILRGEEGSLSRETKDIDVDQAVRYLQSCEAHDYGFGSRPGAESHAGHVFCVIAALSLLGRLHPPKTPVSYPIGLPHPEKTIHWLVSRQQAPTDIEHEDFKIDSHISPPPPSFPAQTSNNGFNGRDNKRPDTCYSFWVVGCLDLLKKSHLVDAESNREYLLENTAHIIGGFGKVPKAPPDVLHSCLGAVSLGISREEGINRVDSALCTSLQTRERVEGFEWRKKKVAA